MTISSLIADGFIQFDPAMDPVSRELFEASLDIIYGTSTGKFSSI